MKQRCLPIVACVGLLSTACIEGQGAVFIEGVAPFDYGTCAVNPTGTARNFQGLLDVGGLPSEANGYDGPTVVVTNLPAAVNQQNLTQSIQRQPNYPNYGPVDSSVVTFERVRVYFTDDRGNPLNVAGVTQDAPRETPIGAAVYNVQTNLGSKTALLAPLVTQQEAVSLQTLDNPELAAIPELAGLAADPTNRFRVIAQIQVIGRTTAGSRVVSPEFGYPIELCQRCLSRVGMEPGQTECNLGQSLVVYQQCTPGQDVLTSQCE